MKPNKFLIFFYLIIINSILVYGISISPGEMKFESSVNQKTCNKVTIGFSDEDSNLEGEDRWTNSLDNRGEASKYTLSADNFNLEVEYPETLENLQSSQEIDLCITGKEVGKYEGILIYSSPSGGTTSVAVGMWLSVDIGEVQILVNQNSGGPSSSSNSNSGKITNEVVKNIEEEKEEPKKEIEEVIDIEPEIIEEEIIEEDEQIEEEKDNTIALGFGIGILIILACIVIIFLVRRWKR